MASFYGGCGEVPPQPSGWQRPDASRFINNARGAARLPPSHFRLVPKTRHLRVNEARPSAALTRSAPRRPLRGLALVLGTTSGTTKAGVHQQFQWQPSWLAPIVTSHAMARTHVISNKQASPTTLAKVSSPRAVAPSSKSSTKKEHAHALRAHRDRTCPFFDCFCSGLDNLLSLRSRSLRPSVNRRVYPAENVFMSARRGVFSAMH